MEEGGRGLRNGGCHWDASPAGVVERVQWKGDGGESAESQEGEFGAEVSAFLSATSMYYTYRMYAMCA